MAASSPQPSSDGVAPAAESPTAPDSPSVPDFDPVPVRPRSDGWTPDRQRCFLEALARCGSVRNAATFTGLSRESAYKLRRRADAKAFARGWDGALILARDAYAEELLERGLNGWTEEVWYHGEVVGERTRFDKTMFLAALKRLDDKADATDRDGAPERVAASHFDALVEAIGEQGDTETLLAEQDAARDVRRTRAPVHEELRYGDTWDNCEGQHAHMSSEEGFRLLMEGDEVRKIMEMKPEDIDVSDLDPADSEEWSEQQWARADRSGLLDRIGYYDALGPLRGDEAAVPDAAAPGTPASDATAPEAPLETKSMPTQRRTRTPAFSFQGGVNRVNLEKRNAAPRCNRGRTDRSETTESFSVDIQSAGGDTLGVGERKFQAIKSGC